MIFFCHRMIVCRMLIFWYYKHCRLNICWLFLRHWLSAATQIFPDKLVHFQGKYPIFTKIVVDGSMDRTTCLGELRMRKDLFLRPLVQLWLGCWWPTRERSSWFRLLDHLDQLLLDHQLITTQGGGDQVTWEPDLRHKGSLDTDKRSNEPGGMHCTYIMWPVMASVYY